MLAMGDKPFQGHMFGFACAWIVVSFPPEAVLKKWGSRVICRSLLGLQPDVFALVGCRALIETPAPTPNMRTSQPLGGEELSYSVGPMFLSAMGNIRLSISILKAGHVLKRFHHW